MYSLLVFIQVKMFLDDSFMMIALGHVSIKI